jgi:lipoic acid synthetase
MSGERPSDPLRVRWFGRVPYREALRVQEAFIGGSGQHLLLLEHDHVFTHGPHADLATNLRCAPGDVGAELVGVNRGGDITYHGPGQLTGYPIVSLPNAKGSLEHVRRVEDLLIAVLRRVGAVDPGRLADYPGVWLDAGGPQPRKVAAIGVRLSQGRTMHGFALNVTTDMRFMREHIVACGIADRPVTSLDEEGIGLSMRQIVDLVSEEAASLWGDGSIERQDVAWRSLPTDLTPFSRGEGPGEPVRLRSRAAAVGLGDGLPIDSRKPEWIRPRVVHGPEVLAVKRTVRSHGLVTVCEDAGCPNLSECWSQGTATFMVLGERCTRACGFCLVDTRHPGAPDPGEPARLAAAVVDMALEHVVLTMVARDDLPDGGFAHVADCVTAIRSAAPAVHVETLVSDAKGSIESLGTLFLVRPDVFNHNIETVPRLQRVARPSAGYARSLSVLAAAAAAGLVTKSGLIVGLGETTDEVDGVLADLAAVGCSIVTIGQYLRPTTHHMPVARWVEPAEFDRWAAVGRSLGLAHVEASPLTRSSHHAKDAAEATAVVLRSR